ncbi:MAG: hypothetical protein JWM36_3142 [Hyphomicrobiales bacterium]|nr:hypothetical protein [Hyphomicrobiales bacterium]
MKRIPELIGVFLALGLLLGGLLILQVETSGNPSEHAFSSDEDAR